MNKIDEPAKSLKRRISVIPAKAGIQLFQIVKNSLDSGLHRSDDFLREHQIWALEIWVLEFEFWDLEFLNGLFFSLLPEPLFEDGCCQIIHGSMVIGKNDRWPGT